MSEIALNVVIAVIKFGTEKTSVYDCKWIKTVQRVNNLYIYLLHDGTCSLNKNCRKSYMNNTTPIEIKWPTVETITRA